METPCTIQQRLQRAGVDESELTSGSLGADGPQTSGSKLRKRVVKIQKVYEKEIQKVIMLDRN